MQNDDFYLVLPSHARSEGVHDNRPQHFKVDLPKELFLEGEWEVGVTELLYTHTFCEPSRFALSDSDLMWEFTNRNVHDWIAVHFPKELYTDKRYRRLVLSMRDTLKEVGDKTGVGPGIDIVDRRDRFHVTVDPGASLRLSLPIAHMFGFLDDNFALRSQYGDGRFQIQHGVQRMSMVWVEQPGLLPLRFEISPPAHTRPPFLRVDVFSITSNLNIEPVFDGTKKSRDLRKIVTKRTSHVQETFRNVHFFKLEQRRIKRVEIALKSRCGTGNFISLWVCGGDTSISKQKTASEMTTPTSDFYLTLPSNASTSMYPKNGPSGFKVALPNVYELHGDEWQVGLASLVYPHTWVNMPGSTAEELKEFRHQGVFYARIFSRRRPAKYKDQTKYPDEYWVALHVAQGHY